MAKSDTRSIAASDDGRVHFFGIRHHGPGCARSLLRALDALQPDLILIEGPADGEVAEALPLAAAIGMQPPVALLVYRPDLPRHSAYYPFAEFSPEWQALLYGLRNKVPLRLMDLPMTHQLAAAELLRQRALAPRVVDLAPGDAMPEAIPEAIPGEADATDAGEIAVAPGLSPVVSTTAEPPPLASGDGIAQLAYAAGYDDAERWWEHLVEHRSSDQAVFGAINTAMAALRELDDELSESQIPVEPLDRLVAPWRERLREAHMRRVLRAAQREKFARIAVVCGAWHVPALQRMPPVKFDTALLKDLPKAKIAVSWTPWTSQRLTFASGYGAGIEAPGWYAYLWQQAHPKTKDGPVETDSRALAIGWLARCARLLRAEDLDVSSAHIIEAVRLAETLATLRSRALPDLSDLQESIETVFGHGGEDGRFALIRRRLLVGDQLGTVPEDAPAVPLLRDLQRLQKSLRLPAEATTRTLELDLRKEGDLTRSHLLYRLRLLDIGWGERQGSTGRGTFKETWKLCWEPEFAVAIIEAGVWGNTVVDAATARAVGRAQGAEGDNQSPTLPVLTELLDQALLADLAAAIPAVMDAVQRTAALTGDVSILMSALPALVRVMRYGSVRNTDASLVGEVTHGIALRLCTGLPPACSTLDDDAAMTMLSGIRQTHEAVKLLENAEVTPAWHSCLRRLAGQFGIHGVLAGACNRLLYDADLIDAETMATTLQRALSRAVEPAAAAAWLEGFVGDSGLILLHDQNLLMLISDWFAGLTDDSFTRVLPLLRRAFSRFPRAERRQIGEAATKNSASSATATLGPVPDALDSARIADSLPLLVQMLGLTLYPAEAAQ